MKASELKGLSWCNSYWRCFHFCRFWAQRLKVILILPELKNQSLCRTINNQIKPTQLSVYEEQGPVGTEHLSPKLHWLTSLPSRYATNCMHPSPNCKYWRHSSPLEILCTPENIISTADKAVKSVFKMHDKNILTFAGYPCTNWKLLLFIAHVESVVPSTYIRKDNTKMRQLTLKQHWGTISHPQTHP